MLPLTLETLTLITHFCNAFVNIIKKQLSQNFVTKIIAKNQRKTISVKYFVLPLKIKFFLEVPI